MPQTRPKTQTLTDVMDPARAAALHAVLNRPGRAPRAGEALPPFWHQIYFWQALPPARLGRDGHAKPGEFLPDPGLPRRMWAAGALEFHAPLICGVSAEKNTEIMNVTRKTGRSGPLVFITLRHDIRQRGTLCIREFQDLVYRADPAPDSPPPVPPRARTDETARQDHGFDAVRLFRYSALTLNGHRIHYDADYCRQTEGYPGLVVHAPLLAQYLMLMAEGLGDLSRFRFRATAPLFHFETASFCQNGADLWVRGPDGRQCMQATATWGQGP